MSSKPTKRGQPRTYGQSGRQRRREAEEAARKQRTRTIGFIAVLTVLVLGAVAGAIALSGGTNHNGLGALGGTTVPSTIGGAPTTEVAHASGPEAAPIPGGTAIAPASTTAPGTTVDGIKCQSNEQVAYHIHAHLAVFAGGQPAQIPAGIGIPNPKGQQTQSGTFVSGSVCLYWLHTHAADGIIHIEAPGQKLYTLGNFFDEWQQPLSPTEVAEQKGQVTAFVDGKAFTGDPRTIVLNKHTVIQLDIGNPVVAPQPFTQWGSL